MRTSGVLMHLTSLPSPHGIGAMGTAARKFVDFLADAGQTYWQLLPICPTSFGDSPYQTFSTFAGNPYLIDLDELSNQGLLEREEYEGLNWGDDPASVDYGLLYRTRYPVLRVACSRFLQRPTEEYAAFCGENSFWLEDYAFFMALKESHGGAPWQDWEAPLRNRSDPALFQRTREALASDIDFWKAVQFLFFRQWRALKSYANDKGISIIGDLPIYVSGDSVDVWASPEQFQLDERLLPTEVAGCPPDGFSADGQLWGNPLFRWDYMEKSGFSWWVRRIGYQCRIYDVLRIDHFRGFDSYYAIPFGSTTAQNGVWREGPGMKLFRAVEAAIGKQAIIAEDLGFLTPSVRQLLADSGFPGMKVLEFAFDSRDGSGSDYLPHNFVRHCVAYTGTHDNETVLGWMDSAPAADVAYAREYLRVSAAEGANWTMMRSIWASVADTAVTQMQDLLDLGSEARMNEPSTVGKNWKWRALPGFDSPQLAARLRHETEVYCRISQH
ncbi:4-alpha-glucanotransferase [uncultured Eubacteriales bacterium]|uniref:4-alpha-glucanotransferase n=1 Tax=uncultured Eubacteriales bacterium TaxID=172733 RepID=A0A212KGT1_9FIRM|nr:4-alpha-glucanotransferase [uncultured Eubacteriales bacterium]